MMATIAMTGDVMLGRLVNKVLPLDKFSYVWGDTLKFLKSADFRIINLECVISDKGKPIFKPWNPEPGYFNFRAHPYALKVLRNARIDCVTLANNHILDYGEEALVDMISHLQEKKIFYTGAGKNLEKASNPVFLRKNNLRIAIIAITDNTPEWEAGKIKVGIHYTPLELKGYYLDKIKSAIKRARENSDIVIVSAHVGSHNRTRPSKVFVNFAHKIIDLGADIYFGTSNHIPQGVEIYKEKVIIYDAGDFVDDYAVDQYEYFSNDQSFIFGMEISKNSVLRVEMIPTVVRNMQARLAKNEEAKNMMESMKILCEELGTKVDITKKSLIIDVKRQ